MISEFHLPGGEAVGTFFRLVGPCLPYTLIVVCYVLIIRKLKVLMNILFLLFYHQPTDVQKKGNHAWPPLHPGTFLQDLL